MSFLWVAVSFVIGYAVAIEHWWLLSLIASTIAAYCLGIYNTAQELKKQKSQKETKPIQKTQSQFNQKERSDIGNQQNSSYDFQASPGDDAINAQLAKQRRTNARLAKVK